MGIALDSSHSTSKWVVQLLRLSSTRVKMSSLDMKLKCKTPSACLTTSSASNNPSSMCIREGEWVLTFSVSSSEREWAGGCSNEYIKNLPPKEAGKQCDCYICLEKCKEGKDSVELPCKHAFCRDCLTNWIKEHDSCPVCRVKLDQNRP